MGEIRCCNSNKIKIKCVIQINITSKNSSARNCDIQVVPHNTVYLLGRDVLQKLGLKVAQKQQGENIFNINQNKSQQNCAESIQKLPAPTHPHGQAEKQYSKIDLRTIFQTNSTQRRKIPLHLVDNVEKELKKEIDDKQIIKL